jgi:hypothetical protein
MLLDFKNFRTKTESGNERNQGLSSRSDAQQNLPCALLTMGDLKSLKKCYSGKGSVGGSTRDSVQ